MGPVMGIAIAAVGLQIVTTNIYAYITDVSLTCRNLEPCTMLTWTFAVLQAPVSRDFHLAQLRPSDLLVHSGLLHDPFRGGDYLWHSLGCCGHVWLGIILWCRSPHVQGSEMARAAGRADLSS